MAGDTKEGVITEGQWGVYGDDDEVDDDDDNDDDDWDDGGDDDEVNDITERLVK